MKYLILLASFIFVQGCLAQVNDNDLGGRMHQYLQSMEELGFQGSVLAAYDGEIVHMAGYGLADRENNIKNESSTIFTIGSITKQFTAAAILRLEMLGKLKVSDLMGDYLSGVPDEKNDITIHQLLTHSAGFPGAIGDDFSKITDQEFLKKCWETELLFKPGKQYKYSNVGYSLLTLIIEKVSEMGYETFLSEQLFKPAGMENTGYLIPKFESSHMAVGYRGKRKWGKLNEKPWAADGPYLHLKGNGGILSNVEDMYQWHLALLGDQILDKASKSKMYAKHIEEGEGAGSYYGYGWAIFPTSRNTELIAHNGGNGVFFADFWRYLDEKMTVVLMSNSAQRKFEIIPSDLSRMMREPDFSPEIRMDDENEEDSNFEDLKGLVDMTYEVLSNGDVKRFEKFLKEDCTPDFRKMVPIEIHYEMLGRIAKKLSGGNIRSRDLNGDQVIIGIEKENEAFEMYLDLFQAKDGSYKIAGILVEGA